MDVKELMIGDWVRDLYHGGVKRWSQEDFFIRRHGHITPERVRGKDIEPVQLTPDILRRNGFHKMGGGWIWKNNKDLCENIRQSIFCTLDTVTVVHQWGAFQIGDTPRMAYRQRERYNGFCRYVHELQHVIGFCCIDKDIVL